MAAGLGFAGRTIVFNWDGATVAGVREKSVAVNGEPIDVTADDSAGWREVLETPAEQQVDLSLSGVTKSQTLKTASFSNSARIKAVTLTYPDGGIISGDFYLATYNETGTYNDATTFECSLQSTGPVTFTPAP